MVFMSTYSLSLIDFPAQFDTLLPFVKQGLLAAWKADDSFFSSIIPNEHTLHDHKIVTWACRSQSLHKIIGIVPTPTPRVFMPTPIRHERAQREWIPARNLFPFVGGIPEIQVRTPRIIVSFGYIQKLLAHSSLHCQKNSITVIQHHTQRNTHCLLESTCQTNCH